MQFANAHLSWLLLLLPILAAICYRRRTLQQKLSLRFAENSILDRMVQQPARGLPRILRPDVLQLVVAALIVVSMLRPQWGFVWRKSSKSGVDLVIAVDVSESMLAKDITPSRLDRARHELSDLVERLRGDRVALVSFAGDAYIECPLTVDYNAFRLFLGSLEPNVISAKGTNIAAALEKSFDAFGRSTKDDKRAKLGRGRTRAVVLITDGESFEGDLDSVREQAMREGISIFVIGIGTAEGAPIPTGEGYKKDDKGHVVITRLNAEQLKQLAVETGGVYVQSISSNADTIAVYDKGIKRFVEDSRVEWGRTKQWNEYYQFTSLAALLLLLAPSLLLGYSRLMREKRSSA